VDSNLVVTEVALIGRTGTVDSVDKIIIEVDLIGQIEMADSIGLIETVDSNQGTNATRVTGVIRVALEEDPTLGVVHRVAEEGSIPTKTLPFFCL
jgi:hypothetical protein